MLLGGRFRTSPRVPSAIAVVSFIAGMVAVSVLKTTVVSDHSSFMEESSRVVSSVELNNAALTSIQNTVPTGEVDHADESRLQMTLPPGVNNNTAAVRSPNKDERGNITTGIAKFRFPSVRERVEYYLGMESWVNLNISKLSPDFCTKDILSFGDYDPGPIALGLDQISVCIDAKATSRVRPLDTYCSEVLPLLVDPTAYTLRPRTYRLMVLMRPGDFTENVPLPLVVKARDVVQEGNGAKTFHSNILWPFMTKRHYSQLFVESDHLHGIPWVDKKDTLIWRGGATGNRVEIVEKWFDHNKQDIDVALNTIPGGFKGKVERIRMAQELVAKGRNITDVLHTLGLDLKREFRENPERMKTALKLFREGLKMSEMVKYKYLLSLEGNDVATGLKWMLWSNSVVLMAQPTKASWAMEDKLKPFVHYIPLKDDHSNIDEMLAWARQHQSECQRISTQATEFIDNLIMSDEAQRQNDEIMIRMRILYQQRFGKTLYEFCHTHIGMPSGTS